MRPSAARIGGGVAITITWLYLWWPAVLAGSVLFARDLRVFTIPAKRYWLERVEAGELPLWSPHLSTGLPYLADVANQALYPGNLLVWLAPDVTVGVTWFLVAHSLGGMLAFGALARAVLPADSPRGIALWGALLYGLSGYVVGITENLTYVPAVVWVPLALAALERGLARRDYRYSGLGALCVACLLLAGDVQSLPLLGLAALALAARRRGPDGVPPGASGRLSFGALHIAGTFALGVALAAAQVLPTMELLGWSSRGEGLMTPMATAFSLPPVRLLELVSPFALGARYPAADFLRPDLYPVFGGPWVDSLYLGAVPLVAAAVAARRDPGRAWPWLALAGLAGLAALGRNAPFYEALVDALPALRVLRYPEKQVFFLVLGLCVAATLGVAASAGGGLGMRRLGLGAALLLAAALVPPFLWPDAAYDRASVLWSERSGLSLTHAQGTLGHLAIVASVLLALALLVRAGGSRRRWPARAILVVALADLLWMHRGHLPLAPVELFRDAPAPAPLAVLHGGSEIAGVAGPRIHFDHTQEPASEAYRNSEPWRRIVAAAGAGDAGEIAAFPQLFAGVFGQARLIPAEGAAYGLRYHNGQLSPLQPISHLLLETAWLGHQPLGVLRLAGVSHVLTGEAVRNPTWDKLGDAPVRVFPELDLRVIEVPDPLPFAYLAAPVVSGMPLAEMLAHYAAGEGRIGVVETSAAAPVAPPAARTPARVAARVVAERPAPEAFRVEVDAPAAGLLVLSESYFPGWTATVDGRPATVELAQKRFLGVRLEAGRHEVRLAYRPTWLGLGAGTSLTALGVLAVLLAAGGRPRTTRPPPSG